MLRKMFWPEAVDLLAGYSEGPASKIRMYSILALFSTILVTIVPYVAGSFVKSLVRMEQDQGYIDLDFVVTTGTLVVIIITFWYLTTTHANKEVRLLALETTRKMREDLSDKLMRMPVGVLDRMRAGDAASKVSADLPAVMDLLSRDFIAFFTGNVMIVVILIAMVLVSPMLALVYLITVPLTLYVTRYLTERSEEDFRIRKESVDAMTSAMSDLIANHRTIKANNLEKPVMEDFKRYNRAFTDSTIGVETRSGLLAPIASVVINLGYVATVVGGAMMMLVGSLEVGMFMAFIVYVRLINKPLSASVASYYLIESETVSLKRVLAILNAPEVEETEPEEGFEPEGRLEFEDVRFSYDGNEVIHGISFAVDVGKVAVITGPTGSGKSTLLNLLLRFFTPDSGRVCIDGRDIRRISRADLVRTISAVMQDPWVFDGTIRENIVYNREWATQKDLDDALRITGFDAYVNSLSEGLDTQIGNDIHVMPLAQRRMLAMSRAILGNPRILVLDEAFSGLDPITESAVFDGLRRMMEGRTVLIVSHERNLIDSADQVIRLDSGRVVP